MPISRSTIVSLALLVVAASAVGAQVPSAPPNSDIFLSRILRSGDSISLSAAQNITRRQGYDNQPTFLTDATGILYTAIDSTGQADIWRYDLRSRRRVRLTNTLESEYSPTMMPGS